jgi:hypothetical protein
LGVKKNSGALGQRKSFLGGKALVERTDAVGVEVVLDQADFRGGRVALGQALQEEGIFALGALGVKPRQSRAGFWFDGGEQRAQEPFLR